MGADAAIIERLLAAGAIILFLAGVASALVLGNAIKRLIGLTLAGFGVVVVVALWAPHAVAASIAVLFAHLAIGAALVVRLQEAYGTIEVREIDAADAASEPQERRQ